MVSEFLHQVHRVPEKHAIQVLPPDRADRALNEVMRNRGARNRLDFLDLEDRQVGEPTVEAKQRFVVGADVSR